MTINTYLTHSALLPDEENIDCVTLKELLNHEDLVSMVQFSFLVDFNFLMSHLVNKHISITIVHGMKDRHKEFHDLKKYSKHWPNVTVAPTLLEEDDYGVHHSKAMILYFNDDTVQLVVMTANLLQDDWLYMTQGVYRSPRCPLKTNTFASSPFEKDLIKYLRACNLSCLGSTIASISRYDWSLCKAILIASVPGDHRKSESTFTNWGLERLAEVLRQHVTLPEDNCKNSQIIMQCSSMPIFPETWFKHHLSRAMSEFKNRQSTASIKPPQVRVVYPTEKAAAPSSLNDKNMVQKILTFEKSSYDDIHVWFDPMLHEWKSERAHRQGLMPHIKTYTRLYEDETGKTHIAWHLLTSANMSRSAWGEYEGKWDRINIRGFELGVLFCPSLFGESVNLVPHIDMSSVQNEMAEIKVRLPFDLPLTRHPSPKQCYTRPAKNC